MTRDGVRARAYTPHDVYARAYARTVSGRECVMRVAQVSVPVRSIDIANLRGTYPATCETRLLMFAGIYSRVGHTA